MKKELQRNDFLPALKTIMAFQWLNETELAKILDISTIIHFEKGETIIYEGDIGSHLYGVIKGEVAVSVNDKNGKDVVINNIGDGEIFGETAIFLASKRTATIACPSETTVMQIKCQDLLRFFKAHPHTGNKLLMLIVLSLLNKLKHTNDDIVLEKYRSLNIIQAAEQIQKFIQES